LEWFKKKTQFSFQEANTLTSAQKCQNMACGNCYTQVSQKNQQTTSENTDVR